MAPGGWLLFLGFFLINLREMVGQENSNSQPIRVSGPHQDSGSRTYMYENQRNLASTLMAWYQPLVILRIPVNVSYGLDIFNIDGVDEKQGVLRIAAFSYMSWVDHRLSWDPKRFLGIQHLRLASRKIWQPDIRPDAQVLQEEDAKVFVYSNGTIYYTCPLRLAISCNMRFANYPYDSHICPLIVESWSYNKTMVDLDFYAGESSVNLDRFRSHGSWTLEPFTARRVVSYDRFGAGYLRLEFNIKLKRATTDYTVRVLAPSVVTSVLLLSSFLIPPTFSQRIVFSCILLLCCLVQLLFLNLTVPLTGPSAPVLGDFLCFSVFVAFFAVVESVVSVNSSQCVRGDGNANLKDEGGELSRKSFWVKARISRIIDVVCFIVFTVIFAIVGAVLLNRQKE